MRRSIRTVLASLFLSLSCFAADGTAPPEPISRIAFLGDSITAGVGVKTPKTDRYSTVATRLLQQRYPALRRSTWVAAAKLFASKSPTTPKRKCYRRTPTQW